MQENRGRYVFAFSPISFIDPMNHQKIYDAIIENAKKQNRKRSDETYYENHHILPRCLGGSEEKENKVLLTAKEHYICHKLLTYIYKGNRKIVNALYRLTYSNRGNHSKTSRDYSYAKELLAITPITEETRTKLKESHKNIKQSEFTKEKRKKTLKGKKRSTQAISNLIKGHLGTFRSEIQKNTMKAAQQKRRKIKQICEYCGKETDFLSYGKYHGDRCKFKI